MENPEKRIVDLAKKIASVSEELRKLNEDLFLGKFGANSWSGKEVDTLKYTHFHFMRYSLSQLTTEVNRLKEVF